MAALLLYADAHAWSSTATLWSLTAALFAATVLNHKLWGWEERLGERRRPRRRHDLPK